MDNNYQDSRCLTLEKVLADKSVAPIDLPFSFLKAITQDFSDNQLIGVGGFGSVYKGVLPNGIIVAVKKLHDNKLIEVQEKDFLHEVDCLIDVKHRNIVRLLGYSYETQHKLYPHEGRNVFVDKRNMLICFEFLSKGSLADYVIDASSGLEWRVRYQIIKGICEGVAHLHKRRIIHMDLKPENILLDDTMAPKITDFGISRRFKENQNKTITENIVGSRGYMAPEFVRSGTISFGTDIYSLGVIIIQILTGSKECPNVNMVLESWTNTFGTSKSNPSLDLVKLCAEIGIDCMHNDPSKRPDIQDITRRLNETDISVQLGRFYQYYRQAKQECKPIRITASVAPEECCSSLRSKTMAFDLLPALCPRNKQSVVCVRVSRKWEFRGGSDNGRIQHVDLVLIDEKGNAMYGEIPGTEVSVKSPLIQENGIYIISRFRVSNAKQSYRAVQAPYMIEFICRTRVEPAKNIAPDFPEITYNLTPIDQLKPLAGDTRSFTDTVGLLVEVSAAYMVQLPNKPSPTLTRNLIVRDSQYSEMKVSLWGERASAFDIDQLCEDDGKPVTILLVGCLMKRYLEKHYLSANAAARWYINPQIPEATEIYNRFKDQVMKIRRTPAPRQEGTPVRAPVDLEMKTLLQLNEMDPYDFPECGYQCTVTIGRLVPNVSWWFRSCTMCSKSCVQDGSSYRCILCRSTSYGFKYKLCFIAMDGTGEAEMICFGDVGRHIVGKPVRQVLKGVTPGNPVPPAISSIVSQTFTFAVTLTQQRYNRHEKTFQVASVVTSHGQHNVPPVAPPDVHDQPAGNASPVVQDVLAIPNSSFTDLMPVTPSDVAGSSVSNATPPPNIDNTNTALAKEPPVDESGTSDRSSNRRKLFTDDLDDEEIGSDKEEPIVHDVPPREKKRPRGVCASGH